MKLINGILRPGRVIEVLPNGCIKAYAPGLFSKEDKDLLPPIMPFFGLHSNTYSSIREYDDVWVLNLTDNPQQLFWFRKDRFDVANEEILKEENVDVLLNKESGSGWATLYFSDGSGWVINNNGSKIQIREDGSILLDSGQDNRVIDICDGSISLGSVGGSAHPAVYGDELVKVLQKIQISLELVRQAAAANAFTAPIATALGVTPTEIKQLIPNITSTNVTLD